MEHLSWPDGRQRCFWANPKNERYVRYHDEEWGRPVHDDGKLFEMLLLECFQAGLSWECVLNKREGFRRAFADFHLEKVCAFTAMDVERLMQDDAIIRHRRKIEAAVGNARVSGKSSGSMAALTAISGGGRKEKLCTSAA